MSLARKNNQHILLCFLVIYGLFAPVSQALAAPGDGKIYMIHNNHLGTPKAMTNEQGVKVWSARHDPFGKATVNTDVDGDGKHVELNARFPGQHYDKETGLHYNYYRYYNPATGRYITSDPIGLSGGLNTFGYVGGNPVRYTDPNGLICGTGACVAGGTVAIQAVIHAGRVAAPHVAKAAVQVVKAVKSTVQNHPSVVAAAGNPAVYTNTTDAIASLISKGPPSPSIGGYLGAMPEYFNNMGSIIQKSSQSKINIDSLSSEVVGQCSANDEFKSNQRGYIAY